MSMTPTDDILAILAGQPPLTAAEYLHLLRVARDQLVLAVAEGRSITYVEIRNRRVQFVDPQRMLRQIEVLIKRYEGIVARQSGRTSRNYAAPSGPSYA